MGQIWIITLRFRENIAEIENWLKIRGWTSNKKMLAIIIKELRREESEFEAINNAERIRREFISGG